MTKEELDQKDRELDQQARLFTIQADNNERIQKRGMTLETFKWTLRMRTLFAYFGLTVLIVWFAGFCFLNVYGKEITSWVVFIATGGVFYLLYKHLFQHIFPIKRGSESGLSPSEGRDMGEHSR